MKTRRKEARIIIKAVASVKSRINLLWLTLIVSVCFSMPVKAQCEATNEAFKSGEHVMYDLYFNWKFVWIKAGLASLTTNATTYHSKPAYRFNLLSVSSKKIDFFFKMRDTLTCIVSEKLEPRYFRKGAEEGKRYTVDEAWFSYKDGLCFVNQKRTYRDGEIIETEYSDSRCVFDMLSILAQARSYDPNDYTIACTLKHVTDTLCIFTQGTDGAIRITIQRYTTLVRIHSCQQTATMRTTQRTITLC